MGFASHRGFIARVIDCIVGIRLGTGLIVVGFAFFLCAVIPALVALAAMNAAEDARESQTQFHQLQVDAETLASGLLRVQAAGRGYAATGDQSYALRANRALDRIGTDLERLIADVNASDVSDTVADDVERAIEGYLEVQTESIRTLPTREPSEVRASIGTGRGQALTDATQEAIEEAEDEFELQSAQAIERAEVHSSRLRAANTVAIVACLLTILIAGIYLLRAVRRPLDRLSGASQELGGGNESARVEPEGSAELRALGESFNSMAVKLQQRRRELEEASRAKSDFLARMSHELRTPLNAILGFGQLLEMDDLEESEAESVRQIMRAGRHLLDLIDEVLDISRIESGSLRISMEPVSLSNVFGDVQSMTAPLASEREVAMVVEPVSEQLHVLADQQRLKQVLLNLLSNGIKYNRIGGELRVRSEESEGSVKILISDSGYGIDPDVQDRLFTPFERLGAEQKGMAEGTGLGLALSHRLASLMGGKLELDQTSTEGTTFAITLDRVAAPNGESDDGPVPAREPRDQSEMVVVCIEDNESNFELVRRILDDHHQSRIYSSIQGSIGLDLVRKHRPDVVLLDLHLPDISGEEVLQKLKSDDRTKEIPVIIMSADATSGHQRRLIQAGAQAYLTKPLSVPDFLDQVDTAMAARGETGG